MKEHVVDVVLPDRYRVQCELARGGMGRVLQVVDANLDRPLAVKVMLPRAAADAELVARFEREARITGALQHPGVPPVVELGRLADGLPFFSMKLVAGTTLKERLKQRREGEPQVDALLPIFEQIAQTVAYAHSQGVIHRDLKPSNVMVGGFGEVQVMDWGMAKLIALSAEAGTNPAEPASSPASTPRAPSANLQETVLYGSEAEVEAGPTLIGSTSEPRASGEELTRAGTIMGTPAYMAPEQARGEIDALDARADVFALGAMLCELLTGGPPYALTSKSDVLQQAAAGELSAAHARLHACIADPALIELAVRCLQADPRRRPADAKEVEAILSEYLESLRKRLEEERVRRVETQVRVDEERKRRRLSHALTGIVALAVVGLAIGMGIVWDRNQQLTDLNIDLTQARGAAERNEQEAVDRRQDAEESAREANTANEQAQQRLAQIQRGNEILTSIFDELNPLRNKQDDESLRVLLGEKLTEAAERLEADAVGDPHVVVQMQFELGTALSNLGHHDDAIKVFQEVKAFLDLHPEHAELDVIQLNVRLCQAYATAGFPAEAIATIESMLEMLTDQRSRDAIDCMNMLGYAYSRGGREADAAELLTTAWELANETLTPDDPLRIEVSSNLALAYTVTDEPGKAIPILEEVLANYRLRFGDDFVNTLITAINLSQACLEAGQPERAIEIGEEWVPRLERNMGLKNMATLIAFDTLAMSYSRTGRVDEAIEIMERVEPAALEEFGLQRADSRTISGHFGEVYIKAERYAEAITVLEAVCAAVPLSMESITPNHNLAIAYLRVDRHDDAIALLESIRDLRLQHLVEDDPENLQAMSALAIAYREGERFDLYAPLIQDLFERQRDVLGEGHVDTIESLGLIARDQRRLGQNELSAETFADAVARIEQLPEADRAELAWVLTEASELELQAIDQLAGEQQWDLAAERCRELALKLETEPGSYSRWAMLALMIGDIEGYREACARLRELAATQQVYARAASVCILAMHADSGILPEQFAELTVFDSDNTVFMQAQQMAACRSGDLATAAEPHSGDSYQRSLSNFVAALALAQLGETDRARGFLQQATRTFEANIPDPAGPKLAAYHPQRWIVWCQLDLLRREVELALQADDSP